MNNKTKTIIGILVIAIFVVGYWLIKENTNDSKEKYKIGVVYLMEHPSITEGIEGFKMQIDSIQKVTGLQLDIRYDNAFGEMINIQKIVKSYTETNTDVILALTTPCAKIAQNQITEKSIIFVGVTDPVGEQLVDDLSSGKGNITGTTSKVPSTKILQEALRLFPDIRRVGILYSTGESNSISILKQLENDIAANNLNVELVKKGVSQTIDIQKVATAVVAETDALFIINDNGIVSSADILIKAAYGTQKPIFASDIQSVKRGALFTYGLNYQDEGIAAANILRQILLEDKAPSEIPVFINQRYYFVVNKKLITEFGIDKTRLNGATIVE